MRNIGCQRDNSARVRHFAVGKCRPTDVNDEVTASLDASDRHGSWAERIAYSLARMELHGRRRAAEMEDALEPHAVLTKTQRHLVGAYFLHEYSFEASALFNPRYYC